MLKKKDNSMNDEEWNAWTADVRVFLDENLEASREQALTSGMEEEEFDDYVEYVEREIATGDKRTYKRLICKDVIQKNGRELPFWPKVRGLGAKNWHTDELGVFENIGLIENEASMAYWNVYAGGNSLGIDMSHTIVQRSSKKRGDGVRYENGELFATQNTKAKVQKAKNARTDKHWGTTEIGEPFDYLVSWVVPFTGAEDTPSGDEDASSDNS